jgi:anti-anti-sigma factor
MSISKEEKEKYIVLKVAVEKLDSIIAPDLKSEMVTLNKTGVANIIVDLSGVKYCDSSGLSALLVGNRGIRELNGTFVISGLQPMVEKLITISQLDKVLNITPTLSEAEDFMMMEILEKEL